jgi:cytochrome c-type biogenesis protein CcmH/NrfG
VFGAVIFAILLVMMFITLSYSNLGNRHAATEEHADPHRQHPNKHDHGQGH